MNSTRKPLNLIKSRIFTNTPCKSTCLFNAPSMHTVEKIEHNFFFSNFSGTAGISRQNPGISRQKSLVSLVSRDIPNFSAPTPSRGRPPAHPKTSGPRPSGPETPKKSQKDLPRPSGPECMKEASKKVCFFFPLSLLRKKWRLEDSPL